MSEPWGISGPTFLWLYLAGVILGLIIAVSARKALRRADDRDPARAPAVEEIAFLAGGPRRVVETAIANLLDQGALRLSRSTGLQATGNQPRTPVEAAVLTEINRHPGRPSIRALLKVVGAPEVLSLRDGLTTRRLLVDRAAAGPKLWLAATPLLLMFVIGIVRWLNGVSLDRPVGILTLLLLDSVVPIALVLRRPKAWRTTAGDAVLARAKAHRTHDRSTRPQQVNDPAMMGMTEAAGLVAIGGFAAYPDPTIRSSLASSGGGSGDSSGTSSSCSSSSSCGGGGCGG